MALRALGQVGRPGGSQLRAQWRGLGRDLGKREAVAPERLGELRGLELLDRPVYCLLEFPIPPAKARADLEVAGGVVDFRRAKSSVLLDEPTGERGLHDDGIHLTLDERAEGLLGAQIDLPRRSEERRVGKECRSGWLREE